MILINLLPPELRKSKGTGVNPVLLAAAGGFVLCAASAGLFLWVQTSRMKIAEAALAQATQAQQRMEAAAKQVNDLKAQITAGEKQHATLVGLITKKVYWAKALDDFANLLAQANDQHWGQEYEVRCTGLSAAPATGAAGQARGSRGKTGPATVTCSWRATYRIYGREFDRSGEYLKDFFSKVEASPFWRENGFTGKTEDGYKGDSPSWKSDINRVVIDLSFDWKRVKVIGGTEPAKPAPGAPAGAAASAKPAPAPGGKP
jgi:Tfp pilus assembly protein PilN